ncbi:hypothetical protein ALI144C_05195 [Actinosynnema sp. ALI-1.44]|uniref:hypothetical protein n=1 Tax=Actinosynnema sp. ALI-1.44 TaxID=1933779 RepID=UPI00097C65B6|nr:hypothetical protein [Actinosynnema sp. ALI-1.44]ONI89339.1 hypothetical protein ALI144C_05195 [Actinosynnema sp. ALI-1.44]
MAADESLWWPVWGPWLILEGVVAVGLAAWVWLALRYRAAKRAAERRPSEAAPGIVVYLDEEALNGINVPEHPGDRTVRTSFHVQLPLGIGGGAAAERTPAPSESSQAVLGRLIQFLDSHDFLVRGDLAQRTVLGDHAARTVSDEPAPAKVQLSAYTEKYVLVTGEFSVVDRKSARLTFEAPVRTASEVHKVVLECNTTSRREVLPDRALSCLGRILWSPGTDGPFRIRAIAVFQ